MGSLKKKWFNIYDPNVDFIAEDICVSSVGNPTVYFGLLIKFLYHPSSMSVYKHAEIEDPGPGKQNQTKLTQKGKRCLPSPQPIKSQESQGHLVAITTDLPFIPSCLLWLRLWNGTGCLHT